MDAELLRLGVDGVVPIRWDLEKSDDGPGTLTGWASVYNVVDLQDDVVVPGAFKKTLAEWRASKRVIPLTLDHNNSAEGVIGSLVKVEDTAYGLKTTFKFASTADAQTARAKAREGHLTGLSIWGGIVNKSIEMVGDKAVRMLKEVGLMFVGLTPGPANTKALVTTAKTAAEPLPDLWVADMRSALAISSATVRKAAVDALVASQYRITPREPAGEGDTTTVDPSTDDQVGDAATYALGIIGESGPSDSSPGGKPSDSLADLLAPLDARATDSGLDALEAELKQMGQGV